MKIKIISSLIFLFSLNAYTQDCENLKNGEVVRIDGPGSSLEKAMVQDQDGLGVCYSNTASLLLQSGLSRHPDVSYLNLSIQYAEEVNSKKSNASFAHSKKGNVLIEAGHVCKTIEIAKKNGGICKRSDVPLEASLFNSNVKQLLDSSNIQKELISNMAKYYEQVNEKFKDKNPNPEIDNKEKRILSFGLKKYLSDLFDGGDSIDKEKTVSKAEVGLSKNESLSFDQKMTVKIDSLKNKKSSPSKKEEFQISLYNLFKDKMPKYYLNKCKQLDPKNGIVVINELALLLYTDIKKNGYKVETANLKTSLYNSITTINSGPNEIVKFNIIPEVLKAIQTDYLESFTSENSPSSGKEAFFRSIRKVLPKAVDSKHLLNLINKLPSSTLDLLENDFKRYVFGDYTECSKGKEYFLNDDGFLKDFRNDSCLKSYVNLGNTLRDLTLGLDKKNILDIEKVAQFAVNSPEINFETAFSGLLSPDCSDDSKITIPESLTCEDKNIEFNFKGKTELEKNEMINSMTKDFSKSAVTSLKSNLAMGISLCTIFFKENPNYSFNNNLNCDLDRQDAYHAVSIVGAKCTNGKMDYLVQNSWGEWALLDDSHKRDEKFGKVWFSEDSLMNNTYMYHVISK